MIFGIIGAMEEETLELIKELEVNAKVTKANMEFVSGELYRNQVVIVTSGIGKVNAAICTQILIDDFKVNKVINVGIAGALSKELIPGDIVVADSLVQHDIDTSFFGDSLGQIPRIDTFDFKCDKELLKKAYEASNGVEGHSTYIGRIVSGDQFIVNLDKISWLHDKFEAIACEMEGASIAQVCYVNKIPFIVIRSISDNAITGTHLEYDKFKYIAINNSVNILKNMM